MTSPDAITDDMIRALRDKATARFERGADTEDDRRAHGMCTVALGEDRHATEEDIAYARRWCMDRLLAGMKGGAK